MIVKNLNGRFDFDLTFHRDLNILVGQNGCGKTSLLKLIWYVYSGNIYRFASELIFDEVRLITFSKNVIEIRRGKDEKITLSFNSKEIGRYAPLDFALMRSFINIADNDSIFMPTFRRIEGGFTTQSINMLGIPMQTLHDSLHKLSSDLSLNIDNKLLHRFIASISTYDIVDLVTNKYSDISEELRQMEAEQSKAIMDRIRNNGQGTDKVLKDIEKKIAANDKKREELLKPFTVLSDLIHKIFKEKQIQLTEKLSLGKAKEAIKSDSLSSGEKQMLSFLCYNFFADDTIIFIDEPEMSLHVDWQRILFPVLMQQNTTNQFIVATHSPFIYAQYQDKQIELKQQEPVTA